MPTTFLEFFNRHEDQSRDHLKLLKKIFEEDGMYCMDFTKDEEKEPYIFLLAPDGLSFQGVRFYEKGDILAFRAQKEPDTLPYGKSYLMDLQDMLDEILVDEKNETKAIESLNKHIVKKLKNFFKQTREAEREILDAELSGNGMPNSGQVTIRNADNEPTNPKAGNSDPAIMKTGGSPYSTTFMSKSGN
jgi:hypothetical protein